MLIDEVMAMDAVRALMERRAVQAFSIQNIFDYLLEARGEKADWSTAHEGMAVRAPFDYTWMEFYDPRESAQIGLVIQTNFAAANRPRAERLSDYAAGVADCLKDEKLPARHPFNLNVIQHVADWTRIFDQYGIVPAGLVLTEVFTKLPSMRAPRFTAHVFALLDSAGRVLVHPDQQHSVVLVSPTYLGDLYDEDEARRTESGLATWGVRYWGAGMMACAFLNCRNVVSDDHEPDERLQHARIKRGKPPFVTYKTLRIVAPGKVRASEAERGPVKGVMPIHLVRGHFAHYTEDRPLFGKYPGTFWMPAHVRGNREVGTVLKDYALVAAKSG